MKEKIRSRLYADPLLLMLVGILLIFGLLVVYSSTSIISFRRFGSETHFVFLHIVHIMIGLFVGALAAFINLNWVRRHIYLLMAASLVFLALSIIPGLGVRLGGAARWLNLGFVYIQPSEFCKIPFLIYLAYSLSKKWEAGTIRQFHVGVTPHVIVGVLFAALILLQPDFGTAMVYGLLMIFLLYAGGVRKRHLALLFAPFVATLIGLVLYAPYRVARVVIFLNPWADPADKGFQVLQALTSFSSGQFFGKGLGNSQGKLFFIPQAHSDFIFSVMGEELGFIGIIVFLIAFGVIIFRGFRITRECQSPYYSLIAAGSVFLLIVQALIHILVNLSLLPAKGMNLPFISTGGSNLIFVMALAGLLINCAANKHSAAPLTARTPFRPRRYDPI